MRADQTLSKYGRVEVIDQSIFEEYLIYLRRIVFFHKWTQC